MFKNCCWTPTVSCTDSVSMPAALWWLPEHGTICGHSTPCTLGRCRHQAGCVQGLWIRAERLCHLVSERGELWLASCPLHGLTCKLYCTSKMNVEMGRSRIWERGCPTVEDFEMGQWSWWGDAKGVGGGDCERGWHPSHLGGGVLGGLPPKKLGFFLLQSRHSSALFPGPLT